jgi:cytochrome P450
VTAEPAAPLEITRTCPYAPPEQHVRFLHEQSVAKVAMPNGRAAWVATRYEDIRTILSDPRFSSNRRHPNLPRVGGQAESSQAAGSPLPRMLLEMDPPEHGPARRAVIGEFTLRRIAALRPRIQQIVDEHIDAMLDGPRPADLVRALALPVPSLVICEMLGVPYDDHDFFQRHSARLLNRNASVQERQSAALELVVYLDKLVRAKEEDPGDDLLGRQILKQRESGEADHGALLGTAFLLLLAGHETTANMISLGTLMLLRHPDALAALREDPAKIPNAVEELLRYFTIAELAMVRVATEDVEIGGTVIPAGEGVLTLANTGNRDPHVFEDADRFDIDRGARNHLAFGYGPHQCLGQNLARVELEIVFETLFRRVPGLRLAVPAEELSFKDDATVYGMHELPVTW